MMRLRFQAMLALSAVLPALMSLGARAVTPESAQVEALVAKALEYLSQKEVDDDRLGARCLAGLAFLKTGSPVDHPVMQRAIRACREEAYQPGPLFDVYSNSLAVIFLCETDTQTYQAEIGRFLAMLYARQKPHGGWGYNEEATGDTSQTQYAVLAMWTAHRAGVRIQSEPVVKALNWLLRTQDPSGTWGYQGDDPGGMQRVKQTRTSVSMLAAGLGSTLMCAHMLGIHETVEDKVKEELDLPPAVTRHVERTASPPLDGAAKIDRNRLQETIRLAGQWMQRSFTIESEAFPYYYLYSVERYKSFEELMTGQMDQSPEWYEQGFALLEERQAENGSWNDQGGLVPDTAFGVLFLIRSMRKSLRTGIGEGLLVGGRGLPQNVAQASVHQGRLVAEQSARSVDELVRILEDPAHPQYEEILRDPRGLRSFEIGRPAESDVPRLRRLIRGGDPVARLVSIQALAKRDSPDDVPTFLYALTDPDRRVVLAARDALRLVSRHIDGFGPDDDFTERQKYDAREQWKAWYLSLRPDATLE